MDALTLAQQIVDVVRTANLDQGRVYSALVIAKELLVDREVEAGEIAGNAVMARLRNSRRLPEA